jgi:hypothetical protein
MNNLYQGNSTHSNTLEIGHEFQDFIIEKLITELGISISIYQSKKYQYQKGESLQGVEIKYDSRSTGDCTYKECKPSYCVGIEVAEKTKASNSRWSRSGIYRLDNSWLYIVGNYDCAWVFGKKHLILMHNKNAYREIATLPTITTMLLPIVDADKYCLKKLVFNEDKINFLQQQSNF